MLGLEILCDVKCFQTAKQLQNLIRCGPYHIMIVRLCYTVYIQLLTQHNQEFQPYIPHPLSCGVWEDLGTMYHIHDFVSASAVDAALVVWPIAVGMVVLVMAAMLILIILCIWKLR